MVRRINAFLLLLVLPVISSAAESGWQTLFDGKTLNGWMWSRDANPPQPSWAVEDGTLRTTPGKGTSVYLLTKDSFTDFELQFEWKAEKAANSGIKYRFQALNEGGRRLEPNGLEYQITDDENNSDALTGPLHATGALYEYIPAKKNAPAGADVWHTGKILVRGLHIEHWVDGQKVVDVDLDSPEAAKGFGASKRKSAPMLMKQEKRESQIALQIHDGAAWFRNLKIRRL